MIFRSTHDLDHFFIDIDTTEARKQSQGCFDLYAGCKLKTENTLFESAGRSADAGMQLGYWLSQLFDGFNEMLGQIQALDEALAPAHRGLEQRVEERTRDLENAHKRLVDISRQAGMTEVATSVLHNVGNVLNSVNVSANLIAQHVQQSEVSGLAVLAGSMSSKA